MCTNPVLIDNPNRGHRINSFPGHRDIYELKDCSSQKIPVPCGHCPECVRFRQMSFVQRVQMEALENHVFFATLTYNNAMIPEYLTSTGYRIKYVDTSDLRNAFKRIRNDNLFGRPFRFVYTTELGSERGRPHVHCLIFIPKYDGDTYLDCLNLEQVLFSSLLKNWSRNFGSKRVPDYRPLCTFIRYFVRGKLRTTYDLHYVNPVLSTGETADVAFYVSKYMIKESDRLKSLQQALRLNLSDEEYSDVWSVVKPRWSASPLFGLNGSFVSHNKYSSSPVVLDYLRDCVSYSRSEFDFPKFRNPVDGKYFPLSRYYLNRLDCVTVDDWFYFHDKAVSSGSRPVDNLIIDDRPLSDKLNVIDSFRLKMNSLDFDYDDFDELF